MTNCEKIELAGIALASIVAVAIFAIIYFPFFIVHKVTGGKTLDDGQKPGDELFYKRHPLHPIDWEMGG